LKITSIELFIIIKLSDFQTILKNSKKLSKKYIIWPYSQWTICAMHSTIAQLYYISHIEVCFMLISHILCYTKYFTLISHILKFKWTTQTVKYDLHNKISLVILYFLNFFYYFFWRATQFIDLPSSEPFNINDFLSF
jgi:hypothetical protein